MVQLYIHNLECQDTVLLENIIYTITLQSTNNLSRLSIDNLNTSILAEASLKILGRAMSELWPDS